MQNVSEQNLAKKEESHQIKLSIPNKPEYLSVVRLTASGIANRMDFNIEEIEDIKLAVAEACTNAMTHGEKENSNYNVEFTVEEKRLIIEVNDKGKGCRVENIKKPQPRELEEGGLGIFIIKSLMDKVEISSKLGKGTTIKMIKNIGG
ncbi:MAG: ATP-binding protein [Clostridiales bacterium]|nr:ATP-binding protein [Clostridiales bacterium]